jgi:hypothetical protein
MRYRDLAMEAPDAERMTFWTSEAETATEDLAAWLASIGTESGTGWGNQAGAGDGDGSGDGSADTSDYGYRGGGEEVS